MYYHCIRKFMANLLSPQLALWAIFSQFPMTCCDINLEMSASALAVHNYSSNRPLLSFANLRSLLSSFGICPAICRYHEIILLKYSKLFDFTFLTCF